MRLRDHLAKYFSEHKKTKTDLYTNYRAMAKLLKEAKRVKKVLSANVEHVAQVCQRCLIYSLYKNKCLEDV